MSTQVRRMRDEGVRLAWALASVASERPVVLAIPRGGVLIADVVARALHAPLDVLVARKVFAHDHGHTAIGAVAFGAEAVLDARAIAGLGLGDAAVADLIDAERARQDALLQRMRGTWPLPDLEGRTVVLVDDAIITGLTMRAALAATLLRQPRRIIVATPLCATSGATLLTAEVDELIYSASAPAPLAARMHDEGDREPCPPLADAEVHDLIARELREVGADPFAGLATNGI